MRQLFEDVQLRRNVRYINRIESRRNLQFHRLINISVSTIPQPKKFLCSPKLPPSKHIYITNIHSAIFSLFDLKKKFLDLYSARRTSIVSNIDMSCKKEKNLHDSSYARWSDTTSMYSYTSNNNAAASAASCREYIYIYMYIPDVNCVWSSLVYK